MDVLDLLRIARGAIGALFVFVPFIAATVKNTFFNEGCMDGFGYAVICALVILYIGAPLSVWSSVSVLTERKAFRPTLPRSAKIFYDIGNALAVTATPVVVYVVVETCRFNFAMFSF